MCLPANVQCCHCQVVAGSWAHTWHVHSDKECPVVHVCAAVLHTQKLPTGWSCLQVQQDADGAGLCWENVPGSTTRHCIRG